MPGKPVFIVDCVRTPIARGKPDGTLSNFHPVELYSSVIKKVISNHPRIKGHVEDVITGVVTPIGKQGANVGRLAALHSGLPVETPGIQINRMCGSGQQAIHFASQAIASGDMDLVLAGGVEMMGTVEIGSDTDLFSNKPSSFKDSFPYKLVHQGYSAELVGQKYGVTRQECDEFGRHSHEKAHNAHSKGFFTSQILPLVGKDGKTLNKDEGVRFPVDVEKMKSLPTIFKKDGIVTAANASQISDGAGVVLLASEEKVKELGLPKRARIVGRVVVGSDPELMLDGVIPATKKILKKTGLRVSDIDVFEVNEAFASVVLAWIKEIQPDPSKVNPNGGAIAHGHPLGGTGAVLMTKLVNELQRRKGRYGLQTMCIGHGMATATIIENLD